MGPLIFYVMFVFFSFHKKNITRESEQWNNEREKRRGGVIIFSVIRVRDSAFITAEAFNKVAIQQINIYSKEPIIAQGQLS